MSRPSPGNLFLVLAGAGTDAIVILGFNILTAAQTGNTILFAVALARGDLATGLNSGLSIASFVGGAAFGGWLCRRRRTNWVFASEIACLLGALELWLWGGMAGPTLGGILVVLAATAMGLQSAVTAHLHGEPGTYVTGLLTQFATLLGSPVGPGEGASARRGLLWGLYFGGAFLAGLLFLAVGPWALLWPIVGVAGAWFLWFPQARSRT